MKSQHTILALRPSAIFVIVILLSMTCFATDVIKMKNGDVYRGEIIQQVMNQYVQIRFAGGNEKRLVWDDIQSISKENESIQPTQTMPVDVPDGSGKISTGWTILGATYGVTAITCAFTCTNGTYAPLIPVAGPFIQIGNLNPRTQSTWIVLNALSGAAQLAGLTVAIIGYREHTNYEEQKQASLQLIPFGNSQGFGAALALRFL